MAHFKLYSVDIDEMFGSNPGSYEYICVKNSNESKYTRLSGPTGGFDIFNIKCQTKQDYKKAVWVVNRLNSKYKNKDYKEIKELKRVISKLLEGYDPYKANNLNL